MTIESFSVSRSGQAPLAFTGECLGRSNGDNRGGREQNRYHNIAVYRTQGGKWVLYVEYCTHWQGEEGRDTASVHDTAEGLCDGLAIYPWQRDVQGYPAGTAYADRQQRLLDDVGRRFSNQVSEVLASEELAERVD